MATRAGILIRDSNGKYLICRAPNRPKDKPNQYDISKGHKEDNEDPEEVACRELKEETGLILKPADLEFLGHCQYTAKRDDIYLYTAVIPSIDVNNLNCTTFFEWYGRQLPEFDHYELVDKSELSTKLYKTLVETLNKLRFFEESL